MKKLQRLFAAVVLTLVLSVSALAGDGTIWPMFTEPTPPPVTTTNNAAADGIISPMFTSADSATVVALGVLQSVLALF